MSSQVSMYCAIPVTRVFKCHGISACVSDPLQATLPLFIHHYGNKDSIHELDQIRSMPFLCQSLFGHEDTLPFWCQRKWRAAADFAITCNKRLSPCWRPPKWQAVPRGVLENTEAIGSNEVLALPSNMRRCNPASQQCTAHGSTQWCQSGAAGHGSAQWHPANGVRVRAAIRI